MKTKRDQYKKERGRMLSALLAFVLAFGLAVAAPSLDGPALAAGLDGGPGLVSDPSGADGTDETRDTDPPAPAAGPATTLDEALTPKGCSLTLQFPETGTNVIGSSEKIENPATGSLVVDVYKIADAVRLPGYQTYQFSVSRARNAALYDAIDKLLTKELEDAGWYRDDAGNDTINFYYAPDPDAEDVRSWSEFVDALARACLLKSNKIEPVRGQFGETIEDLDPGLYLTVVHGTILDSGFLPDDGDQYKDEGEVPEFAYPQYITAQKLIGANDQFERYIDGTICTELAGTAYDETYLYLFQPQLVSLPGYSADGVAGLNTPNNTSDPAGSWQTAVTLITKHGAKPRYIDLQIVKKLPTYLAGEDSVTFVYQIEYTDEKGNARTMTEAISFDGPSKDGKETRVIVSRIPLTSDIKVTEIYTGYTYQFAGVEAQTAQNLTKTGTVYPTLGTPDAKSHSITIHAADLQAGSILLTVPNAPDAADKNPTAHTARLDDGVTHIVTFSNDLAPTNRGGGSVVNSFAVDADSKWTWTKRAYDSSTQKWKEDKYTYTNGKWEPVASAPAGN